MNLLDETKSAISQSEHSTDDVRFVGSRDEKLGIPWSQAEKVLDIDYDEYYGCQEIAPRSGRGVHRWRVPAPRRI